MRTFTLYGTGACHLCETAHDMLVKEQEFSADFTFDVVDISDSDALFERFGLRIPVLLHPDRRELGWPFSSGELRDFLQS